MVSGQGVLILSCRPTGSTFTCRGFDGSSFKDYSSDSDLPVMSAGSMSAQNKVVAGDQTQVASLSASLEKKIEAVVNVPWQDDSCMNAIMPNLRLAARYLKLQVASGRPVFLRFNADTDGISAGLHVKDSLVKFASQCGVELRLRDVPSPPAIYEKPKAVAEMRYYEELGQEPVCVLVDHCANPESVNALKYIKGLGFPVVILDHHPPDASIGELTEYFISPFAVGFPESKYTAGLLCYEFARAIVGEANEFLLNCALQADSSTLARKKGLNAPLAIDFYAQCNPTARLEEYSRIVKDESELEGLYLKANKLLNSACELAWSKSGFEQAEGYVLVLTDLNGVVKKRTFPSKGIVMNFVQTRASESNPSKRVISVCYVGDSLGFRANKLALDGGFDANKLILKIKEQLPRSIRSGGGHAGAASLQIAEEGDRQRVRELALSIAKEQLGN